MCRNMGGTAEITRLRPVKGRSFFCLVTSKKKFERKIDNEGKA